MRAWSLLSATLLAALMWTLGVAAEVAVPALQARVTDLTSTLSATQQQALESRLASFERDKGSQVAVLIVPTTQPETIEQYSIRVVEQWKLGRAATDDGVLLLVAKSDRALRIEVGQGLEGAIPDAVAKRIIEEIIVPRFRANDLAGGINAGVDAILALIRGEALPAPPQRAVGQGDRLQKALPLLFVLVFAGQILRRALGHLPGAGVAGGLAFLLGWWMTGLLVFGLMFALAAFVLSLSGMSTMGGWSSRGGGGGGGGFGGGGGSFSGGGASGRW